MLERIIELEAEVVALGNDMHANKEAIGLTAENAARMLGIIKAQAESIRDLYGILYKIAPDLEIIEAMAENEAEELAYIDRYMNLCKDWEKACEPEGSKA